MKFNIEKTNLNDIIGETGLGFFSLVALVIIIILLYFTIEYLYSSLNILLNNYFLTFFFALSTMLVTSILILFLAFCRKIGQWVLKF